MVDAEVFVVDSVAEAVEEAEVGAADAVVEGVKQMTRR